MNPIKVCDIVLFKGQGLAFQILSALLSIFSPTWRRRKWKPWHTALVWQPDLDNAGWWLFESTAPTTTLKYHDEAELRKNAQIWRWFPEVPFSQLRQKFYDETANKKYDIEVYLWTALAVLVRHYYNKPIPKLLDHEFSCWEHTAEGCDTMGKSLVSKYDVIVITDLLENLEKYGKRIH